MERFLLSSASVGTSQCKVGVRSVTMEPLSGLSKAKSPGRSFTVLTLKVWYPPLFSVDAPFRSSAITLQK